MSEGPSDNSTGEHPGEHPRTRTVVDVLLYAAARLVLVVALSAVIYGIARLLVVTQFPVVVAVLFALIIGMPLGIWLFGPLRRRATAGLAIAGERRRREREQLQARLRGEPAPDQEPGEPGAPGEPRA